jgi:hypothetical protein
MLYKLLASLAIAASLPVMAHAQIYSHTSASSNTGGNAVGPGGIIETGGASASVSASSARGSSNSSVYIRTNANGTVREESYTSSSTDVSVSVESTPKETVIETREGAAPAVRKVIPASPKPAQAAVQAKRVAVPSLVPAAFSAASVVPASIPQEQGLRLGARIALSVRSFFAGLFSWFM